MKMKMKMKVKEKACELCNEQAALYCASDSAFLCWKCDAAVHHANFLVARHRRHLLCSGCNRFAGINFSGTKPRLHGAAAPTCRSCSEDAGSLSSGPSSSSSACVSSSKPPRATATEKTKAKTEHAPAKRIRTRSCSSSVTDDEEASCSAAKRKRRKNGDGSGEAVVVAAAAEEEEVFVKWSEELGLGLNDGNRVVSLASKALSFCLERWKSVVPFKVAAATSFWLGLRFCGISWLATFRNLWKLEVISGVPTKLILTAHAKLARVFYQRRLIHSQEQEQEGCDES